MKHREGPAQVESLGEWQDAAWRATQGSGAAAVQLDLEAVAFLALHLRGALAALAPPAPPPRAESGPPPGASAGAPSHRVAAGFPEQLVNPGRDCLKLIVHWREVIDIVVKCVWNGCGWPGAIFRNLCFGPDAAPWRAGFGSGYWIRSRSDSSLYVLSVRSPVCLRGTVRPLTALLILGVGITLSLYPSLPQPQCALASVRLVWGAQAGVLAPAGSLDRARHVVSQLLETMGVGEVAPAKPLLWRHGGRPQLAASLQLAALQRALHAAAATHFYKPAG